MAWDPTQYLKFADERLRPGFDLLARIGTLPDGPIFELGCGTGIHSRAIAERWLDRAVAGIDSSKEMLAKAAASPSRVGWHAADIVRWTAPEKAALVFSNATLQWLDDHQALFPRLMAQLAPGGVLAVQMPRNHGAPSHALMHEVASDGPWAARLMPLLRRSPVAPPEDYYDLLAPLAGGGMDIWETEYLHVLAAPEEAESPVLTWVRATALRPLLAALGPQEQAEFTRRYEAALRRAYPRRGTGAVLLPFRRLFLVARG